jgi:hypothetical protein
VAIAPTVLKSRLEGLQTAVAPENVVDLARILSNEDPPSSPPIASTASPSAASIASDSALTSFISAALMACSLRDAGTDRGHQLVCSARHTQSVWTNHCK